MSWTKICQLNDILPFGGRCALHDGQQVAIFRVPTDAGDTLYATSNFDPFSKANVLSRGLVGCTAGKTTVASPIYKEHFELSTGQCLEDETVTLKTWDIKLEGNDVLIASEAA